MSKKTIAVVMGGISSEHEVSLDSGKCVLDALDAERYVGVPVTIGRDGTWAIGDEPGQPTLDAALRLRDLGVDCVFIALHGPHGEDGRIQGFFETAGLPYTGSGCAASALAMDKTRCKAVVSSQGIRVAGHLALDKQTWMISPDAVLDAVRKEIGYPCIVKPGRGGSSVGIQAPEDEAAFAAAIEIALAEDSELLVETFITGREVTCGVLDAEASGYARGLPVTEILPVEAGAFWTYDAKYTPGATEEITPAALAPPMAEQIQDMALHVHDIVGCSGWSRSDFILDEQGPVWLEVNTVPGLTKTSLYPQQAEEAGISYTQMVTLFIEKALSDFGAGIPAAKKD